MPPVDDATRRSAKRALTIEALGVVFGDIGTSPLYTVQTVFSPDDPNPVAAMVDSVFGVVSLIFWSVMIIATVMYVLLVPLTNWTLMVSVLTLVFTFESFAALAFAFGMAVTGTITITILLFFYLAVTTGEPRAGSSGWVPDPCSASTCSSLRPTQRRSPTAPGSSSSSASRCSRS